MKEYEKQTKEMLQFIEKSPTAFHAVENLAGMAKQAGYTELKETEEWNLKAGCGYYVIRGDSSIAAFRLPEGADPAPAGFHIVAAHSDSPTFKLKENAEIEVEGHYTKLNTEPYGGMILSTWLDRPLSVAGRVTLKKEGKLINRLVNVDRDLLVIPNVAIHMCKELNQGMTYNAQTDMPPLLGEVKDKKCFLKLIAKAAGAKEEDVLAYDLFLYVRDKGRLIGAEGEYVLSPRLDDLQCAFAAMTAMTRTKPDAYLNICAVFDNEEVGSRTRQGADSTFLSDILERIKEAFSESETWLRKRIADSLFISADNAHAVHPNHPEKADPTNRPYLNGGIVIKYHGSQRYTTDSTTAAALKALCEEAKVPMQTFANRSDLVGGSTLGNISTAHVSVPSVDIGLPQLAMHSAVETAGVKDTLYAVRLFEQFYVK